MYIKNRVSEGKYKGYYITRGAFGNGENCCGLVEKVDDTEEGLFTKYIGCKYIFKGYPKTEILYAVGVPKRMISGLADLLAHRIVRLILAINFLIFLLLPKYLKRKIVICLWDYFLSVSQRAVRRVLPPKKYCLSVKEIYRAASVASRKIKGEKMLGRIGRTRDIGCMTLEYDFAYKAMVQDVLPKLDKNKAKKNPAGAIKEIIELLLQRTEGGGTKNKFKGLGLFLRLAMWTDKEIKNWVIDFLSELDLEKIKLDKEDWYYCLDRTGYNYGGFSHEARLKIREKMDIEAGNQIPRIILEDVNETRHLSNN